MIRKEVKILPPKPLSHSLVSIREPYNYPVDWGNYWSLRDPDIDTKSYMGDYVVNMWYENFIEIVKRLDLKEVEVEVYQQNDINIPSRPFCFITDKRIPKSWWIPEKHGPCITGCNICSDMMQKFIEHKFCELYNS